MSYASKEHEKKLVAFRRNMYNIDVLELSISRFS